MKYVVWNSNLTYAALVGQTTIFIINKNYENIVKMLKAGNVYGNKTVESIQNAGFPDLSMKFVVDPKQKFNLALKSGKLDEAKEAAEILKEKVYFDKLAEKAMMMGKLDIAEFCYVKSQNIDKLIFFYTITGRQDKLNKVTLALKQTGDNSRRFLNAIYTCNNEEKINVLRETGHSTLALLVAKLNDRNDLVQKINDENKKNEKTVKINEKDFSEIKNNMGLLTPLKPIVNPKNKEYHSNWSSVVKVKKQSQQASIDSILNQKEEEENDLFGHIASDNNEKEAQIEEPKNKKKIK